MNKSEIILKEWRDQENPYGDPATRPDSEIWGRLLSYFQKHPKQKYLTHFHQYKFTPDKPTRYRGSGIGRSRLGTYTETLTIFWQPK